MSMMLAGKDAIIYGGAGSMTNVTSGLVLR
jgi:hypothetical protein